MFMKYAALTMRVTNK